MSKNKILDQPRSEAAHRELSRLPTPGLIDSHVEAESKHRLSKHRPNFTGAKLEVLLQNVDVSILFHYGYIHAIEFSAYLFIHLYLQCSCSAFIYFRTSRCLVE